MSEFIEIVSKSAFQDIEKLDKSLVKLLSEIKSINKEAKEFKLPSGATRTINRANRAKKESNALDKEAKRLSTALERQKAKLHHAQTRVNQELIKYRFETQQTNRLAKQRAIISSRLSTEYQKEQARLSLLSNRYKDLATKQEMGVRLSRKEEAELKDVTRQIERKQRALKKVDANMGVFNRNVGNYKSAWKGIGGLVMASVTAFGAFSAIDIGRQIFSQVKAIDALDKALKQVTETQEGFVQAQSFVIELADETGIQINELQKAYTKFYAASKTTNLSLKDTQNIFRQTAKAGAVLGLSTDQVNGAMTALEQILSKGKVQAEEIRGQLGERLPGAFQILAKSMGLTTAELSKQLELGNVISEDVLPNFATELEKTFGLDKVKQVDTLNAAQGRLSNSWNLFIRNVEEGSGVLSTIMTTTLGLITDTIKGWDRLINYKNVEQQEAYNQALEQENQFYEDQIGNVERLAKIKAESATTNISNLKDELRVLEAQRKGLGATSDAIASKLGLAGSVVSRYFLNNADSVEELDDEIQKVNISLKGNEAVLFAANQQLKENTEETKNNVDGKNALLKGTVAWYEKLIQGLENEQVTLSQSSEKWQEYEGKIQEAKDALLQLKREFMGLEDVESVNDLIPETELAETDYGQAELEAYQNLQDEKEKALFEFTEKEKALIGESFSRIADLYGIDASKFTTLFDDKENTVEDYAEATGEVLKGLSSAIYQKDVARIDAQIAASERYYNREIEMAEGNKQKQRLLREEQERERRKLEAKKLKAQKEGAIFESIINTAVGVTKALASANPVLAAIIGTLGAIETALIASKPIPQYKKGRKGGKEEVAILGDGYRNEPIIDKHGNLKAISPDRPTMMQLDRGDSVLPSMNDLMRSSMLASVDNSKGYDANKAFEQRLLSVMKNSHKDVIKSLRKANFINQNNVKVDLGFSKKKQEYS